MTDRNEERQVVKIHDLILERACGWNGELCPDRRDCYINGCKAFTSSTVEIPARYK